MKIAFAFVVIFATGICAAGDDKKTEDTATATPQALTIPKDAVLNPDGRSYSYTDKQGKKWNYLRTPFGITRVAATDKSAAAPTAAPTDTSRIKIVDKGDTVRFERQSPFGPIGWEKKKSELTDEERRIFDSYKADAHRADLQKAKTQQNEKTQ
jgi:hypothetical protein